MPEQGMSEEVPATPTAANVTLRAADADAPNVLQLERGNNILGRGMSGLSDRRISRVHASVRWSGPADDLHEQHVWVESTGSNPLQVRRAYGTTITLKHGDAASLCHGDELWLLPNLFPFVVEIRAVDLKELARKQPRDEPNDENLVSDEQQPGKRQRTTAAEQSDDSDSTVSDLELSACSKQSGDDTDDAQSPVSVLEGGSGDESAVLVPLRSVH